MVYFTAGHLLLIFNLSAFWLGNLACMINLFKIVGDFMRDKHIINDCKYFMCAWNEQKCYILYTHTNIYTYIYVCIYIQTIYIYTLNKRLTNIAIEFFYTFTYILCVGHNNFWVNPLKFPVLFHNISPPTTTQRE